MPEAKKARAVGINHVALEVGDIEEALAFYGRLFDFRLRGKSESSAFIDLGDQFSRCRRAVPNPQTTAAILDSWSMTRTPCAKRWPTPALNRCPNRIEIVAYENIRFTKAPNVLRGMGLAQLSKNETALKELADKGMAPD